MSSTCPECGSPIAFEDHEVHLRTGTCSSCSHEFAFVEGTNVAQRLGTAAQAGPRTGRGEERTSSGRDTGPDCQECGSPLEVRRARDGRSIELVCDECETTTVYVPRRGAPEGGPERESPRRFEDRASRSRPCRQCGAPLRFSTQDDGTLVGECDACGNRFELPARDRRPGGRRGPPGKFAYGSRRFSGRSGPKTRYAGNARGGPRRYERRGRRDRRAADEDDQDR